MTRRFIFLLFAAGCFKVMEWNHADSFPNMLTLTLENINATGISASAEHRFWLVFKDETRALYLDQEIGNIRAYLISLTSVTKAGRRRFNT